ncbi:MAG: DNA polymerase Y family protein [Gemmatimonadota bacterium]
MSTVEGAGARAADAAATPDERRARQERRILLCDADAFFVAVARLVDPEGAGRARYLIVGGRTRGVVCSASYEARQMGVRSAMPVARARRLCPQAMCVPVPGRACSQKSREIRAVLERFSPVVHGASIDEWYLDMTGTEALYHGADLAATAAAIRDTVLRETGLQVSLGGGSNRLIAKLAVERAKPRPESGSSGVFVVLAGGEGAFMAGVTLAEIPGVGPRFRARLEIHGLATVPDVLRTPPADLERMLGQRTAHWLIRRSRGEDESRVPVAHQRVSLGHEETFGRDLATDEELRTELVRLVTRVASDLRARGSAARTVSVKLRDADFRTRLASRTLKSAVSADRPLLAASGALLDKLRKARRQPARLLGVTLSSLETPGGHPQLALFASEVGPDEESPRDRALARAVDRVRERFGSESLEPARITRPREQKPDSARGRKSRRKSQ